MLGAQAGAVREDDPGVHLQTGVAEGGGRLAEGVARGPVTGRVGAQRPSFPVLARRVQRGRVRGGDDAVARVAGVSARVEWYAEASVTCRTPSAAIRAGARGSPLTSQG